jgi:hypothetical protein
MNEIAKQTLYVMDKLDDTAQTSVLKFAEFLAAENAADVALYDEAKAADDGYRMSSEELRKKYGI